MKWWICAAAIAPLLGAELHPQSLAEFNVYVEKAEKEMAARAAAQAARLGEPREPVVVPWDAAGPLNVQEALIHDWIGAVFVPGARVEDAVAVLQDVSRYPEFYSGDIFLAKLISRDGDRLRVLFRIRKKKVITVILETEYDVDYRRISAARTQVWSRSTRIAEVEAAGTPSERVKPPDTGWGFMWRLNTYWHLEERDGGLLMECRAISLTRGIPAGLGWIIKPMVTSLPREALSGTLIKTRVAVGARAQQRQRAGRPGRVIPRHEEPAGIARAGRLPL